MSDKLYCYPPDYEVLKNLGDYRDPDLLYKFERNQVRRRAQQVIPTGDFDLSHLQAIHKHLFQDVYEWAGQNRQVEITKGLGNTKSEFGFAQAIPNDMSMIHRRLSSANYFKNSSPAEFSKNASTIIGDINYVHPFRDGNGRTQLIYLRDLARQADHKIDLARFERDPWIDASIKAHNGDYSAMRDCIRSAIVSRSRDQRIEQQAEQALKKVQDRQPDEQKPNRDHDRKR